MNYLKNYNLFLESNINMYGYHITNKKNLPSIFKNGLLPNKPTDYGVEGDVEGIYLFKSIEDTQNALMNWLGERIEEWEEKTGETYEEVCLKIDMSNLHYMDYFDSAGFEWTVIVPIPPENIVEVIEKI